MKTYCKDFPYTAFGEAIEYANERARLGHNTRRMRSEEDAERKVIRIFWSANPVDIHNAIDIRTLAQETAK